MSKGESIGSSLSFDILRFIIRQSAVRLGCGLTPALDWLRMMGRKSSVFGRSACMEHPMKQQLVTDTSSTMQNRIANFLLLASAGVLSFVCVVSGHLFPQTFRALYRLKTLDETRAFMPAITRLAADYSWTLPVFLVGICLCSFVVLRRLPDKTVPCITVGLCAQGLVTWAAMFCFCYPAFTGGMCLHHGPEFEFERFVSCGAGVFPVTFVLLLAPMIVVFWPRVISRT